MKSTPDDKHERTTDWQRSPAPAGNLEPSDRHDSVMETGIYGFQPAEAESSPTLADSQQPQDLPQAFGRYEVRGFLGRGGFGTVYVGHDTQLDRKVAIKVPHGLAPEHTGLSFLGEARRLAQLRHPGIIVVHDIGLQDGRLYIVTDFLDGVSLRDWIKKGPLSPAQAVEIVARVADALMHSHAQRIIHRDVKPANIMLTGDAIPVLVDFGLSLSDVDGLGSEQRILGTPAYMSPEQAQGLAHRIDGRTDIFSLGVVLYRLLCQRLPFAGDSVGETLRRIIEDDPQPPRQMVPDLSAELERVCLKALARRIEDRYTTARDFALELRRAVPAAGTASSSASDVTTQAELPLRVRPAAEPERRRLTLLLCNCEMADSTSSLDSLDPEDQHAVQRLFHRFCTEVAARFGGTMLPSTGREVFVCFGYPVAHEDAALRGVRTGVALLQELPRLNEQLSSEMGVRLAVWVGIHTGQAVVGDGDASRSEGISIVGEARNVAIRLEPLAELGAVTITGATRQLTQGFFTCESRGTHAVKGMTSPLELFRVLGETSAQHRLEVEEPTGLTPLIGRDTEVSILRDRWEQAAEGMGQVVLLIGEAGLGKSRLVRELKDHVGQNSDTGELSVIEWRCSPYHQNSSLNPAKDFLGRLLRFGPSDTPGERLQRLAAHLERLEMTDPETLALFAGLLAVPTDRQPTPTLSPQRLREKTQEVLLDWLDACVKLQSVLFIVEDLHWIDPSSLELLGLHVARGFNDRILTLLTFRPEFETPWKSKAHQTQIALNRLNKRQIADMMRRKTGRDQLPQRVIEEVAARTDGIPLFVEEFTKVLMEAPAVQESDSDSTASAVLKLQEIPATLEDLLMARLDRMASNREVVQFGATLGREFSYELLRAACSLDEPALQAELAKLVHAELLFMKGRPPRTSYTFKHALIQDAAYQSMLKRKRQQVHKKIAGVLVAQFSELTQTEPEQVARHYAEAGLVAEGTPYWLKAGLRCQATFANTEAIRHFMRGLELLATLPSSRERDEQELAFQVPLGVALFSERGYATPEVGPIFERARTLCLDVGGPSRLFYILWGIWAWRIVRSELALCGQLAKEMLTLAESLNDDSFRAEADYLPQVNAHYGGDFVTARRHGEESIALQEPAGCRVHAQGTGQNCSVTARNYLAMTYWSLGHVDRGLALARETAALGKELGHPFTLSFAYHHIAQVLLCSRLWDEALALVEQALVLAEEQGFKFWYASATIHRGICLAQLGRSDEGLALMHSGLDAFKGSGASLVVPIYHAFLGDVYLRRGQHVEALKNLEESFAWANRFGQLCHESETHRLKGEVLLAHSEPRQTEAETCFQQAIEVARRQQAKSWELRATMSLARLWSKQGRCAEARTALEAVSTWFTEGFDTPDLREAKAMLAEWS